MESGPSHGQAQPEGDEALIDIKELAAREKRAEANKRNAEESYQEAWWNTTMALGSLTDQKKRLDACNVVANALGHSVKWTRDRAKTGKSFYEAGILIVKDLPPRMALELATSKHEVNEVTVENLRNAGRTGMSLREYSRSLTGKSWSDTAAGASSEKITEIFAAQPEVVAELVANDPTMLKAVQEIHWQNVAEDRQGEIKPQLEDRSWSRSTISELVSYTQRLRRETAGEVLTDKARANIRWVIAELTAISEGDEFIGELESWLEEATSR
jgi:hypothetical protein